MTNLTKPVVALALVASVGMLAPTPAPARTKDIVKYGAIGLGAAYLYNLGQRSNYGGYGYSNYGYAPYYGGGYYTSYPRYSDYYGGGYGGYHGGGCHHY